MRNYRKKNKRAKTSSTKQRPAQSGPQPMSVKQNKASIRSTAKGAMKPRGKSTTKTSVAATPAAKKQKVTAKPAVEIDAAKIVAETIAGAAAVKSTTGSTEVEEDSTVDSSAATSSTDKMYA
jgi:hypothetical protein